MTGSGKTTTVKNIALSWTGDATLNKVEMPGHGEVVWERAIPGIGSPIYLGLENTSIFTPGQQGNVKLYFDGFIKDQNLNIKFFAENSTNTATAIYPMDFNETFINASFSVLTLISDNINTGGKNSKVVKTTLVSTENNRYLWESGENIIFNITTAYPEAWVDFFNNTLVKEANLVWDYDGVGAFYGDYYITSELQSSGLTEIKLILNFPKCLYLPK